MPAPRRKDLYQLLGVARDADENAIRKAYRKLARKHHPDVNPGDKVAEEKFKEISEAYAVLSNAEKRRAYDEFGDASLQGGFDAEAARRARESFGARFGGAGPGRAGGFEAEGFAYGDLEDMLGNLFERQGWRGAGGPRAQRGADLEAELELDLVDAASGGEKRLAVTRPTADAGLRSETVTVRIPPGVTDGGRIRVPGRGAEGRGGGPAGDLHATIRIRPHPVFHLEGRDLHLDVPISVREAVLGAKVEIPTLDGRATLTVPPGSDSGTRLRLRGKGFPNPAGGVAGDLYVTLAIRVPRAADARTRELLDELAKDDPSDLRKDLFR